MIAGVTMLIRRSGDGNDRDLQAAAKLVGIVVDMLALRGAGVCTTALGDYPSQDVGGIRNWSSQDPKDLAIQHRSRIEAA